MRSREQTLGTRLSPSEYAAAKLAADVRGLNVSVWLRQVIVAQTSAPDRVLQTLLEEIAANRYILNNLILYLTTAGKEINMATLSTVCSSADALKSEKARRLLDRAITEIHTKEP